ncbi:hypothetical protein ABH19_06730 [Leptospirillum sp. Group II 'CF-1']|jgi:hypothetical protein|nr:hypothetical protein ABH19_06730 [Leptospirillum sp. Group II 'CF-1']
MRFTRVPPGMVHGQEIRCLRRADLFARERSFIFAEELSLVFFGNVANPDWNTRYSSFPEYRPFFIC